MKTISDLHRVTCFHTFTYYTYKYLLEHNKCIFIYATRSHMHFGYYVANVRCLYRHKNISVACSRGCGMLLYLALNVRAKKNVCKGKNEYGPLFFYIYKCSIHDHCVDRMYDASENCAYIFCKRGCYSSFF